MGECYIRRHSASMPYTPIDYILFDGTADSVLDTGIPNGDNIFSITFDINGTGNKGIFGLSGSYPKAYIHLQSKGNDTYSTSTGSSQATFSGSTTGKHTFVANTNGHNTFDGEEVTTFAFSSVSGNYRIGRYYNNSTSYYFDGKIYEVKITSVSTSDVLLCLRPVQYEEDGTVKYGFYDTVSKTLVTKTGWTGGND